MECLICNNSTLVTDSRPVETGRFRRRTCSKCGYRFTTVEIALEDMGDIVEDIKAVVATELQKMISGTDKLDSKIKEVFTKIKKDKPS